MTKRFTYSFFLTLLFLGCFCSLWAQVDTTAKPTVDTAVKPVVDTVPTTAKKPMVIKRTDSTFYKHSPRTATLRSAIIPGWGQAYNRQYWKIPIVYGALGTTAGIFLYNLKNYRDFRLGFSGRYKAEQPVPPNSPPGTVPDSSDYWRMKDQFRNPLWTTTAIRKYRDEFRKDIDYSVLVFLIFWGLNVADAAAAAHLRTFDVSPDLTLKIKPVLGGASNTYGIGLVLAFK